MQQVQVSKWGNSLGFRIPRAVADHLGIQAGEMLELVPSPEGLLVRTVAPKQKNYALVDIIDSFCTSAEHSEVDFGKPQGEELW